MSSYYRKVLKQAQAQWPAGYLDPNLVDWDAVVYAMIAAQPTQPNYQTTLNQQARRQLLLNTPGQGGSCYLWRNFATTGQRANEHEIYVPAGGGYFAVMSFRPYVTGVVMPGRFREGLPVLNLLPADASVTKTGTWAVTSTADMYPAGSGLQSSTAGDTIAATMTGHTLLLRLVVSSNGGFGLVAIDGDYTAATRLPAVTQSLVDAGYFVAGDLGKRYVECYAQFGAASDEHFPLAEGLTDTAHTITVQVKGTKRAASTATRIIITSFMAGTASTLLTDTNASMGYTRQINNPVVGNAGMSPTYTPEFTPTGFVNYQFLGDSHGSETQSIGRYLVDGIVVTPAAGALVAGTEIKVEVVNALTHPSTGATVVANKTVSFTGRADRPLPLSATWSVEWLAAGTNRACYGGQLLYSLREYFQNAFKQDEFNRGLVGDVYLTSFGANNESSLGTVQSDTVLMFSAAHDSVALVHILSVAEAVNNWMRSAPSFAFLQDRTDLTEKAYFARSTASNPEPILPGNIHTGTALWRFARIPGAAAKLGF